ncbi:MAG: peptidase S41, partial [Bacteroidota bacterium]
MRIFFPIILLALLATACGKWIVGDNPRNSARNNYEVFYQTVKENYSFFPEKDVDWDALDQLYRPMVNDSMSNDSLYYIISTMLHALNDGHVNLYVGHNRSRNADWYLDYPANFNQGFLNRNYWGTDYQSTGPLLNTWLDSIG